MSKQKLFLTILLAAGGIALAIAVLTNVYVFGSEDQPPLPLAVVAPLSGEESALGRSLLEGVELEVARLNLTGGVAGRKIVVQSFDDGNDPQQARVAAKAAVDSGALAVIGHTRAATLETAEPVYAAANIPLLTLAADLNASPESAKPFAGRLLSDETYEIRFLSNYLRNVVGEKSVHLLYEDSPRGTALANAFDETLQRFGTRVVYRWTLTPGSPQLKDQAAAAAKELMDGKLPGTVLVIADSADSARAVAALRASGLRNPIAGTRSFATDSFIQVLKRDWRGSGSVDAALTGSLLSVPMLYDVAGQAAQNFRTDFITQFKHAPDWVAAYANDAARLVLSQLRTAASKTGSTESDWRTSLLDRFSGSSSIHQPVLGLDGPILLNPQGRDIRPPLIGTYDGIDLISTLIQLVPIREEGFGNLMQQFVEGRALYVNDRFMYRTNVVYTAIRPYTVSDINVREGTVDQEFQIWFRWRGDFEPQDVVFGNAVTPIVLEKPEHEATIGEMQYRSYRVKGKFFLNFSDTRRAFDTQLIGVAFTHRLLSRHNLMYVTDVLGMGLTRNNTLQGLLETSNRAATQDEGARELIGKAARSIRNFLYADSALSDPLINLLSHSNLLAGTHGWTIDKAWLSQDTVSRGSDGDPNFVGFGRPAPEFSRLEMGTILKPDLIRARDVIPSQHFLYIAVFSAIGALLAFLLDRKQGNHNWGLQTFLLRLVTWPLLLVSLGNLLLDYALISAAPSVVNIIWILYRIALWFVPAGLLMLAIERFIWSPVENRTQRKIPNIMRLLTDLMVFMLALIGVMAYVFEQNITNMLAATGLSAMIVGLAIKDSIANVFSGIIINLEKPFGIGDFIKVNNTIGKVVDITWRTTRIQLDAGHVASMPNAKISEAELHNLSRASTGYECNLKVVVDSAIDPEQVRPLLAEAIKDCPYVLDKDGRPDLSITVKGVANLNQAWLTSYSVSFRVKIPPHISKSEDYFWPRLWKQFHDAGISWKDGGEDAGSKSHSSGTETLGLLLEKGQGAV
jgi:ABC-type branched-subunit amino acid transport system substrate-binding protein/small-conductance mechanosensitive channel